MQPNCQTSVPAGWTVGPQWPTSPLPRPNLCNDRIVEGCSPSSHTPLYTVPTDDDYLLFHLEYTFSIFFLLWSSMNLSTLPRVLEYTILDLHQLNSPFKSLAPPPSPYPHSAVHILDMGPISCLQWLHSAILSPFGDLRTPRLLPSAVTHFGRAQPPRLPPAALSTLAISGPQGCFHLFSSTWRSQPPRLLPATLSHFAISAAEVASSSPLPFGDS